MSFLILFILLKYQDYDMLNLIIFAFGVFTLGILLSPYIFGGFRFFSAFIVNLPRALLRFYIILY